MVRVSFFRIPSEAVCQSAARTHCRKRQKGTRPKHCNHPHRISGDSRWHMSKPLISPRATRTLHRVPLGLNPALLLVFLPERIVRRAILPCVRPPSNRTLPDHRCEPALPCPLCGRHANELRLRGAPPPRVPRPNYEGTPGLPAHGECPNTSRQRPIGLRLRGRGRTPHNLDRIGLLRFHPQQEEQSEHSLLEQPHHSCGPVSALRRVLFGYRRKVANNYLGNAFLRATRCPLVSDDPAKDSAGLYPREICLG